MNEVKIAFNRQTWNEEGTYYRGCFVMDRDTYEAFVKQTDTTNEEHFLNITGTHHLIQWLRKNNVPFNIDRACGAFNYYIHIKN